MVPHVDVSEGYLSADEVNFAAAMTHVDKCLTIEFKSTKMCSLMNWNSCADLFVLPTPNIYICMQLLNGWLAGLRMGGKLLVAASTHLALMPKTHHPKPEGHTTLPSVVILVTTRLGSRRCGQTLFFRN